MWALGRKAAILPRSPRWNFGTHNTWSNPSIAYLALSTRIKDAGIAIRHSRGYIISILQGPEMDLREWNRWVHTQKTENHIKKICFSCGKKFWGRQTGWKTRAGSAGSDNEALWSCKRRVTARVVQNDSILVQNQENQGLHFSDVRKNPGFDQRSLRGTLFAIFGPARGQIYGKTAEKI